MMSRRALISLLIVLTPLVDLSIDLAAQLHQLAQLFGVLVDAVPARVFLNTDALKVFNHAVLALTVFEGDDMALGHWSIRFDPKQQVDEFPLVTLQAHITDLSDQVALVIEDLSADRLVVVWAITWLELGSTALPTCTDFLSSAPWLLARFELGFWRTAFATLSMTGCVSYNVTGPLGAPLHPAPISSPLA